MSVVPNSKQAAAILFHGLTAGPSEMKDLASFLDHRGIEVFVPCLSGHQATIQELKTVRKAAWLEDAVHVYDDITKRGYRFIFVIGLSFGALLSLYLAQRYAGRISGVVALSPPLKLRSWRSEMMLRCLSLLPEWILDRLGTVRKSQRPPAVFAKPREALDVHLLGALARLFQLRRLVLNRLASIHCPVLVLQDPDDHLVSPQSPELLAKGLATTSLFVRWIPGGQHELTLGHSYEQVFGKVFEFIDQCCGEANAPGNNSLAHPRTT